MAAISPLNGGTSVMERLQDDRPHSSREPDHRFIVRDGLWRLTTASVYASVSVQAGHIVEPATTPLTTLADLTAYATAQGITLTAKTKPAR